MTGEEERLGKGKKLEEGKNGEEREEERNGGGNKEEKNGVKAK